MPVSTDSKPIVFTDVELTELMTLVTSMNMKIQNDKHVSRETKDLFWSMFEKLRKARHDY